MEKPFTVLITGTSKGFGYDLVRIFLKRHPKAVIYATAR
jgi:NAD(P)-dependent dehydrogenase (short-subunit alcohol dehydrogenase family)